MSEEVFKRTDVTTEHRLIRLNQVTHDKQKFAFRPDVEYKPDSKSIAALAEELFLTGMRVPLLVQLVNGVFLLLDGHRRYFASKKLVQEGKWTADQLVPAQVVVGDVSEQEQFLGVGAANLSRRAWDDGGMVRYADALSKIKVPVDEIARVMGKGAKQIRRYLLVGGSEWAQQHVADRNIDLTRMSTMLAAADKYDRREDFMAQLDAWVAATKAAIMVENRRRDRNDQEQLSGDQLDPQRHLKAETVTGWKIGLKTGVWDGPSFRFNAVIDEDPATRKRKIEIDRLSTDLEKLTLEETAKVFQRCRDLADSLEPVLLEKQQAKAAARPLEAGGVAAGSAAMLRLAELGLADLIDDDESFIDGDDDDDFDAVEPDQGKDLAATVQLPEPPSAAPEVAIAETPVDRAGDDGANDGGSGGDDLGGNGGASDHVAAVPPREREGLVAAVERPASPSAQAEVAEGPRPDDGDGLGGGHASAVSTTTAT